VTVGILETAKRLVRFRGCVCTPFSTVKDGAFSPGAPEKTVEDVHHFTSAEVLEEFIVCTLRHSTHPQETKRCVELLANTPLLTSAKKHAQRATSPASRTEEHQQVGV